MNAFCLYFWFSSIHSISRSIVFSKENSIGKKYFDYVQPPLLLCSVSYPLFLLAGFIFLQSHPSSVSLSIFGRHIGRCPSSFPYLFSQHYALWGLSLLILSSLRIRHTGLCLTGKNVVFLVGQGKNISDKGPKLFFFFFILTTKVLATFKKTKISESVWLAVKTSNEMGLFLS